jgi:large subunit ribosomal protein L21
MSKTKILNPKAWYLVGAGAVALAADGARRLIRRRRADGAAGYRSADVAVETEAKTPVAEPVTRAATLAADDLTEIKGIGPVFAERLHQAGITTFADVAKASADHLREVTHATSVANPDEWIAQAKTRS